MKWIKRLWQRLIGPLKRWYLARVLYEIREDMNVYSFPRGFQLEEDAGKSLLDKEPAEG
ncbi:hypothetical protein MYX82_00170 [Acidobacteria bacterium AH-259-D05]|nr:hypothetical protein [Acidobacteria bacterium AH-259-D05]